MRRPRCSSHASNGPGIAPALRRQDLIRSQNGSRRAASTAPASTSPCPFRYLVAECTTRSAPNSNGRVSTGVATVLSTATRTPAACARSHTAARSVISHIGLAGVSTQSSRVRPGRMAAATAARSPVSVNSTSRPQVRANSASHLRTPQYRTRETRTWSPGSSDWNTAVAAAIPEPNSAQAQPPARAPPSSAASSCSACSEVGLSARV